jgi:hypothetical protein
MEASVIRIVLALLIAASPVWGQVQQPGVDPITMSAAQIRTASYDQLVAYLTSHNIGRKLFSRGSLPLEYARETARCLVYTEKQEACPAR